MKKSTNIQSRGFWLIYIMILLLFATISSCKVRRGNSFIEEEVKFTNPTDGAILAGTFTKPDNNGHFPSVILISGSGLQDRDETINGHKPFKVLAEYLNKHGIAVLRFDDRGAGKSTGDVWNATIGVFASDALAGIKYLKTRRDVNPNRIGIIGHSLGAMQGAMLASESSDVAFLIMLGGPGVPWAQNNIEAEAENLRLQGKSEEIIKAGTRLLQNMLAVMQASENYGSIESKLNEVVVEWKRSLTGKVKAEIEEFSKTHPDFWKNMTSEYALPIYLSVAVFDPADYLGNVHCPVLSLIGDKDVQILSSLNNPAIEKALIQADNENYSVLELKDINHVFQKCETGLISEYAEIDESFNEEVLEIITFWIINQTNVKPSDKYRQQTPFTNPGKFAYLYDDLPKSIKKNCDIIKRQLIHPMEAADMPKVFPKVKLPEDGDFPIVSDMLRELVQRNNEGLIMDRLPENRLLVACYHHGLLLASILRSQGKSVRLRAGFARYYEDQMNVRFSHVVCEVWNADKERWEIIDPDRNFQNVSYDKFEFPAEVWHNYINDNLPNVTYYGSIGQGDNVYIHSLLLDMAFILGNERNYWHTPGFIFKKDFDTNNLKKEQIQVLNQIANLMNDPANNFKQLEKLYNENPFIQTHERTIDSYYERNYN